MTFSKGLLYIYIYIKTQKNKENCKFVLAHPVQLSLSPLFYSLKSQSSKLQLSDQILPYGSTSGASLNHCMEQQLEYLLLITAKNIIFLTA